MHQGLKELAPEGLRQEPRQAEPLELCPVLDAAVEVVDDEAKQEQAPARDESAHGSRPNAPLVCKPTQERQPKSEPHREEELGHDRIGVAAVGVVMLEDRRDDGKAAQEVHEQHSHDGVAAKLVQRDDAALRARRFRHQRNLTCKNETGRSARVYYGVSPRPSYGSSQESHQQTAIPEGRGLESAIAEQGNAIDRFYCAAILAERSVQPRGTRRSGNTAGLDWTLRCKSTLGGSLTGEIQKKLQSGLTAAGNRRILCTRQSTRSSTMFAQMIMMHRDSMLIRLSLSV